MTAVSMTMIVTGCDSGPRFVLEIEAVAVIPDQRFPN